jgi:hypothetical protein
LKLLNLKPRKVVFADAYTDPISKKKVPEQFVPANGTIEITQDNHEALSKLSEKYPDDFATQGEKLAFPEKASVPDKVADVVDPTPPVQDKAPGDAMMDDDSLPFSPTPVVHGEEKHHFKKKK